MNSARKMLGVFAASIMVMPTAQADIQCPVTIEPEKSLVIRDLSVVEDPVRTVWTGSTTTASNGAWSFGRLMANMAGNVNSSDFVRRWLAQWETSRTVNGFRVPARRNITSLLINPWPKLADGRLDLTKAPFRLLAITFRGDLRDLSASIAGEGRFIFGALDQDGEQLPFTVIFEYRLPATSEEAILATAESFAELSSLDFGPDFNTGLEVLTNQFAGKGVLPRQINGSAIRQVRTNEIALAVPWELREFNLAPNGSRLRTVNVKRTMDDTLNDTQTLADWIDANWEAILTSRSSIEVPLTFNGASFRAGASDNRLEVWDAPVTNPQADETMFRMAINTCNGCHGTETNTNFVFIEPRDPGVAAELAGFFTGIDVPDPRIGTPVRTFAELDVRKLDLEALLCPPEGAAVAARAAPDSLGRTGIGDPTLGPSTGLAH